MKFSSYILLLLSISVVFYMMGHTPLINIFDEKGGSNDKILEPMPGEECTEEDLLIQPLPADSPCREPEGASILPVLLIGLMGSLAVIALLAISGFSVLYIIPILLLLAALNFFIFPTSLILSPMSSSGFWLATPIVMFFNTIAVLAILDLIRGGV